MSAHENLAIAAHLHVLLRRKTGRVTDTEWMATNAAYAAEIVRFARAKALETNEPELATWADKLHGMMQLPTAAPRASLMDMASRVVRQMSPDAGATPPATPARSQAQPDFEASRMLSDFHDDIDGGGGKKSDPNAPRYVKSLR
jgi:hypothetical protein